MVTDRLGLRVAGSYQNFGGWIDNPLLGQKNVNGGHALTLRGKLAMLLGEAFKLTLTAQHQELRVGAQNLSNDDQQVFDTLPTPFSSKATLVNALATYDFGAVTLLSSTSYIDRKDGQVIDSTAAFAPFVPPLTGLPPGSIDSVGIAFPRSNQVFTQELRLSSDADAGVNWTVGGFFRDSSTWSIARAIVSPDILPADVILFSLNGTYPENSKSWAVFGEASYRLTDTLTAIVGLRYFEDRRVQDSVNTTFNVTAIDQQRGTFNTTSPRFNLSWRPSEQVNIYANVGKGFRSGGFNQASAGGGLPVPGSFTPDTLWSYEVGGKFQSADRKLSLDFAGYRNEWKNVQSTTNIAGLPSAFTTNSGDISGWGIDGSLGYRPLPGLNLALTGGWNNMTYNSNTAEHLSGDRADYVPRFAGSASVEYNFNLASLPSFVRVDYQYAKRFQVFVRNFQPTPAYSDRQNILNARMGVAGANWSGSIFVHNLLNRDSVIYPAFAGLTNPSRLQPRTIGASFSVNY